jgi:hypothetical protein
MAAASVTADTTLGPMARAVPPGAAQSLMMSLFSLRAGGPPREQWRARPPPAVLRRPV